MSAPVYPPPQVEQRRRLMRCRDDKVIGGVAGGLGVYFGIDPVIVRLVFVVLALAGGDGILAYVIAWIVIPEVPEGGQPALDRPASSTPTLAGLVLVALGGLLLADQLLPVFSWRYVGPVLLIVLGGLLLAQRATDRCAPRPVHHAPPRHRAPPRHHLHPRPARPRRCRVHRSARRPVRTGGRWH